jgi:hypothetical protein
MCAASENGLAPQVGLRPANSLKATSARTAATANYNNYRLYRPVSGFGYSSTRIPRSSTSRRPTAAPARVHVTRMVGVMPIPSGQVHVLDAGSRAESFSGRGSETALSLPTRLRFCRVPGRGIA